MSRPAELAARARSAGALLCWVSSSAPTPPPSEFAGPRFACLVEDYARQTYTADVYDPVYGTLFQGSQPYRLKCVHLRDQFHLDFDKWVSGAVAGPLTHEVWASGTATQSSPRETTDAERRARTVAMLDGWLAEAHSKEAAAELAELKSALNKNRKGERRLFSK